MLAVEVKANSGCLYSIRDEKKKSCEWQPVDYTTDEPIRRHFKAYFSSSQAAEEFATIFRKVSNDSPSPSSSLLADYFPFVTDSWKSCPCERVSNFKTCAGLVSNRQMHDTHFLGGSVKLGGVA